MLENDCTKDVFREMDGFLMLMSIISTIDLSLAPGMQVNPDILGAICLIFQTLAEAVHKSPENSQYFSVSISNITRRTLIKQGPVRYRVRIVVSSFDLVVSRSINCERYNGLSIIYGTSQLLCVDNIQVRPEYSER